MKITWLGHSCFLLEDSKGIKLLTDPFDSTLGYEVYKDSPRYCYYKSSIILIIITLRN